MFPGKIDKPCYGVKWCVKRWRRYQVKQFRLSLPIKKPVEYTKWPKVSSLLQRLQTVSDIGITDERIMYVIIVSLKLISLNQQGIFLFDRLWSCHIPLKPFRSAVTFGDRVFVFYSTDINLLVDIQNILLHFRSCSKSRLTLLRFLIISHRCSGMHSSSYTKLSLKYLYNTHHWSNMNITI